MHVHLYNFLTFFKVVISEVERKYNDKEVKILSIEKEKENVVCHFGLLHSVTL